VQQVARALGLEASTVTRLADWMVAAGHVSRGREPGHGGVVTLELTASGKDLVGQVEAWRERELARIYHQLPAAGRVKVIRALRQLVEVASEGYGTIFPGLVRVTGSGRLGRRAAAAVGPALLMWGIVSLSQILAVCRAAMPG